MPGESDFVVVAVKCRYGHDALAEYVQSEVLVGGMDCVALQAKTHEYGLYAQYALEVADNGDAATAPHGQWALTERFLETPFGGAVGGQSDGAYVAVATVERRHFELDALRSDAFQVRAADAVPAGTTLWQRLWTG